MASTSPFKSYQITVGIFASLASWPGYLNYASLIISRKNFMNIYLFTVLISGTWSGSKMAYDEPLKVVPRSMARTKRRFRPGYGILCIIVLESMAWRHQQPAAYISAGRAPMSYNQRVAEARRHHTRDWKYPHRAADCAPMLKRSIFGDKSQQKHLARSARSTSLVISHRPPNFIFADW